MREQWCSHHILNKTFEKYDNLILVGDWNFATDSLDVYRPGVGHQQPPPAHTPLEMLHKLEVDDLYRHQNPDEVSFTFRHRNNNYLARLDRIYAADDILPYCEIFTRSAATISDHDVVGMVFNAPHDKPAITRPVRRMSRAYIHQLGIDTSKVHADIIGIIDRAYDGCMAAVTKRDYRLVAYWYDTFIHSVMQNYNKYRWYPK